RRDIAYGLVNLADVVREQGDLARAAMLNHEALAIASEVGAVVAVVGALDSLAEIACSQGRSALATQVFALATILRESHQLPRWGRDATMYPTRIAALPATLGKEELTTAGAQGRKLSLDEATQLTSPPKPVTASANAPDQAGRNG